MKRPRPYIPVSVRLTVAWRQFIHTGNSPADLPSGLDKKKELADLLEYLFGEEEFELHHDPALINRPFNERTGKYTPDANDPEHLYYLRVPDHDVRTRVRGEHGQYSDLGLRRKNKRMAKNRDPNRKRVKIRQREEYVWPSRPFPKKGLAK